MNKKVIILGMVSSIAVISSAFIVKFSTGKTDSTGSPGENTCASCHGGGSGTTMVNVLFSPALTSGSYTPNQTYTVTVNVVNNPFSKFGFACELLDASTLSNAGTMNNAGIGVQFLVGANGRNVATHTSPKTGTGSASFTFEWTAPSSGTVNVYAMGNAVNGNGNTSGDTPSSPFTTTLVPDVTGIPTNISIVSNLMIYPNPAKDFINVQFYANTNLNEIQFKLFDLNGKISIEQKVKNIVSGLNNIQINIPDNLKNGIYVLKTFDAKESISKLVLIQN